MSSKWETQTFGTVTHMAPGPPFLLGPFLSGTICLWRRVSPERSPAPSSVLAAAWIGAVRSASAWVARTIVRLHWSKSLWVARGGR